ncbi:MAG: YeeE/YedE family protein [Leptothrix sp. (in: b-proteobacteria)]
MTFPLSPEAATQAVIWGGLPLGGALGAVAQSTRFCTMGALSDWFTYGGTARLMMWLLAIAVAATGSIGLIEVGWLDASQAVAWSARFLWLSYLVGGLLFGYGMVLASGCPQRSLVKAGAGNLKAWVTLLVAAVVSQMTLRGLFAVPRVEWLDAVSLTLAGPQDFGSMLARAWPFGAPLAAGSVRLLVLAVLLLAAAALLWRQRAMLDLGHWVGGALVGLLVPLAWALTGHVGFFAEHPDTLEPAWLGTASHRPEALTFAAPLAHSLDLLTLWSDRNLGVTFGVTLTLGVLLGSAVAALWRREFRIESFRDSRDLGDHLLGGVLMGFGGVTAMGCSIGQGLTGIALLSTGAVLALAGIVAGTWLALGLQSRRLDAELARA